MKQTQSKVIGVTFQRDNLPTIAAVHNFKEGMIGEYSGIQTWAVMQSSELPEKSPSAFDFLVADKVLSNRSHLGNVQASLKRSAPDVGVQIASTVAQSAVPVTCAAPNVCLPSNWALASVAAVCCGALMQNGGTFSSGVVFDNLSPRGDEYSCPPRCAEPTHLVANSRLPPLRPPLAAPSMAMSADASRTSAPLLMETGSKPPLKGTFLSEKQMRSALPTSLEDAKRIPTFAESQGTSLSSLSPAQRAMNQSKSNPVITGPPGVPRCPLAPALKETVRPSKHIAVVSEAVHVPISFQTGDTSSLRPGEIALGSMPLPETQTPLAKNASHASGKQHSTPMRAVYPSRSDSGEHMPQKVLSHPALLAQTVDPPPLSGLQSLTTRLVRQLAPEQIPMYSNKAGPVASRPQVPLIVSQPTTQRRSGSPSQRGCKSSTPEGLARPAVKETGKAFHAVPSVPVPRRSTLFSCASAPEHVVSPWSYATLANEPRTISRASVPPSGTVQHGNPSPKRSLVLSDTGAAFSAVMTKQVGERSPMVDIKADTISSQKTLATPALSSQGDILAQRVVSFLTFIKSRWALCSWSPRAHMIFMLKTRHNLYAFLQQVIFCIARFNEPLTEYLKILEEHILYAEQYIKSCVGYLPVEFVQKRLNEFGQRPLAHLFFVEDFDVSVEKPLEMRRDDSFQFADVPASKVCTPSNGKPLAATERGVLSEKDQNVSSCAVRSKVLQKKESDHQNDSPTVVKENSNTSSPGSEYGGALAVRVDGEHITFPVSRSRHAHRSHPAEVCDDQKLGSNGIACRKRGRSINNVLERLKAARTLDDALNASKRHKSIKDVLERLSAARSFEKDVCSSAKVHTKAAGADDYDCISLSAEGVCSNEVILSQTWAGREAVSETSGAIDILQPVSEVTQADYRVDLDDSIVFVVPEDVELQCFESSLASEIFAKGDGGSLSKLDFPSMLAAPFSAANARKAQATRHRASSSRKRPHVRRGRISFRPKKSPSKKRRKAASVRSKNSSELGKGSWEFDGALCTSNRQLSMCEEARQASSLNPPRAPEMPTCRIVIRNSPDVECLIRALLAENQRDTERTKRCKTILIEDDSDCDPDWGTV